ncbi:MAG: hypothetical protein KGL39_09420 [Patescibacteria group bacterium]|nr:hypothetical protein [Patescibacteria group bacterium]
MSGLTLDDVLALLCDSPADSKEGVSPFVTDAKDDSAAVSILLRDDAGKPKRVATTTKTALQLLQSDDASKLFTKKYAQNKVLLRRMSVQLPGVYTLIAYGAAPGAGPPDAGCVKFTEFRAAFSKWPFCVAVKTKGAPFGINAEVLSITEDDPIVTKLS